MSLRVLQPEVRARCCDRCLEPLEKEKNFTRGVSFILDYDKDGRWDAGELELCDTCALKFDEFMDEPRGG